MPAAAVPSPSESALSPSSRSLSPPLERHTADAAGVTQFALPVLQNPALVLHS